MVTYALRPKSPAALIALTARKFISPDQLGLLTERSEGWATRLCLAALALADHDEPSEFIRRFSGAFGPVAEYLELEMLLRQPPDLIRFLLETSVLDHLNAEVCKAVKSGHDDAGEILGSLADRNLFVIPICSQDAQYRYHRLFADVFEKPTPTRRCVGMPACPLQRGHLARTGRRRSLRCLPSTPEPNTTSRRCRSC